MVLVAYSHGLRASEVTGFTRSAVRDGHLTIKRLKGSLKTTQPLLTSDNPLLNERAALESAVAGLPAKARVFDISRVQFWRLLQKYCKVAGIPDHLRHPHILKHSVAMHSIKQGGIENLKQYLGHKSLSSTGQYLKVDDAQASAAIQAVLG